MLPVDRRQQILALLEEQGSLTISALSAVFQVSEMTIHRDLDLLAEEGLLRKVRGGAVPMVLETAVTPQENQSWVTCTIRDTGPGINAADLPNLFDRFYRGESSHDFTVPGIGLGLAICHDIVNKLGGHLTVESEPGQGAAFTIWLQLVGAA